MDTETDLLRTIDAKRTPDTPGVGVLPVGAVVAGNLAVQRIADACRRHREWIELDVLQVIVARRRKIEIENALGIALERNCVAQMGLIPGVFVIGKRTLAAEG